MNRRERMVWSLIVAALIAVCVGREYQHASARRYEVGDRVRYNPVGLLVPGESWVIREVYRAKPPRTVVEYLIESPDGESAVVTESAFRRPGLL